ncbi:MAG TPA: efflux transporter outer membrane subunit [Spongiibacteraceae bacterium]|nr:efflux transporter outer membrane subunit [Spongiibacteraceae bacterium]
MNPLFLVRVNSIGSMGSERAPQPDRCPRPVRETRLSIALLAALATLAGCAVGPDYKRPQNEVPAEYRGAPTAATEHSLADLDWAQVFPDPVLVDLIHTGLANNYDLRTAAARVEEYRSYAGVARGALFPQVGIGAGYLANNGSRLSDPALFASDHTERNYNASLQLSWEFDLFGRLRRQDESAIAQWLATEQGRRGVVVTLIGDIATAYFTLLELDLEHEISIKTLKSNTEQTQFYRDRLEGGASNRLEVDQAEANRAATAATAQDVERRIALQENLLNLLLGRGPGPVARGDSLTAQSLPPELPLGLPLQLLERRPDILQAEQNLIAANADIGAAKALFFPSISITAATGGLSHDFNDLGKSDAGIWSFGTNIFQPLFQGGAIRANYAAAKARFDQAMAQYQKAVQNGFRDTADAVVTIEKKRTAAVEVEKGVIALRDAADLARARYEGGLSSYLDILIADQALFSAELSLAQIRADEHIAVVNLYRALGGGWQAADATGTAGAEANRDANAAPATSAPALSATMPAQSQPEPIATTP